MSINVFGLGYHNMTLNVSNGNWIDVCVVLGMDLETTGELPIDQIRQAYINVYRFVPTVYYHEYDRSRAIGYKTQLLDILLHCIQNQKPLRWG